MLLLVDSHRSSPNDESLGSFEVRRDAWQYVLVAIATTTRYNRRPCLYLLSSAWMTQNKGGRFFMTWSCSLGCICPNCSLKSQYCRLTSKQRSHAISDVKAGERKYWDSVGKIVFLRPFPKYFQHSWTFPRRLLNNSCMKEFLSFGSWKRLEYDHEVFWSVPRGS